MIAMKGIRTAATLALLMLAWSWSQMPQVSAAEDFDSLYRAITAANAGGESAITLTEDITLSGALPPITGSITIDGAGHTISGAGEYRIFDVAGGQLALSNVTLAKGRAAQGGAILLRNGAQVAVEKSTLSESSATNGGAIATSSSADSLTVIESSFIGNIAEKNGGAIYANGGTIHISNAVFSRNCAEIAENIVSDNLDRVRVDQSVDGDGCRQATYTWTDPGEITVNIEGYGGGIRLLNGARATIEASTFRRNKSNHGGGIALSGASAKLTVSGSSFASNFARHEGGAVNTDGGTIDIRQSSFHSNYSGSRGGALFGEAGEVKIANSTFYNNRAASGGGVMNASGADVTLTHLTMVENRATFSGADSIHKSGGSVRLRNSIIVSSSASDDCVGGLDQMAGNLSVDGTCALLASDDPLLDDRAGETAWYPLKDFSPAVNAADPDYCLDVDQVGTARPHGDGCDIGAFESTTALPKPPPIEPPPPCPLALQIVAANTDAPAGGCPAGSGHDVISLTGDIELDERLPSISSDITIEGKGFTISGGNRFRIFTVDSGTFTVNDLTLAEGKAPNTINEHGGAIRVQGSGRIAINNSTFQKNSSSRGGAIGGASNGGRSTVKGSRFVGNQAPSGGGAIDWGKGSSLEVSNSSFHRNSALSGTGGAIGTLGGTIHISNSTFTENWAMRGGAVYARWGAVTLTHVTMYDNSAFPGAGLMAEDRGFASDIGVVKLRNSLIAGGGRNECGGRLAENAGNFTDDGSCSPKVSGDPLIELPAEGSTPTFLELLPGSPAIGAADPRYCLPTDQLGRERPRFSLCDIGAIESIPVITSVSDCTVTTTHTLNFREQPGGTRFGTVPENATVTATARTAGWFQVEYRGTSGWISADYVVAQGVCG